MILVAVPKSASTSLSRGFAGLLKLKDGVSHHGQGPAGNAHSPEFPVLSWWMTCCREYDPATLNEWAENSLVYRKHVPPTPDNLKVLAGRHVFLHRDPADAVEALGRWKPRLMEDTDRDALHEEIQRFINLHLSADPGPRLVITFDEVRKDPRGVLKQMAEAYGVDIDIPEDWSFPKYMLSGHTPLIK